MFGPSKILPIPVSDLVSFVFEARNYDQNKPIYIDALDTRRSYSFNQAKSHVHRLAAGLRNAGLQKGDAVLINSLADIDYSVAFLGIIAAGGIWTGSNPYYTEQEYIHQLEVTRCRFILTEEEHLDRILPASDKLGIKRENIYLFDHGKPPQNKQLQSWRSLLERGNADWELITEEETAKSTIAAYVMSSGTTGLPKAVQVSHYNFVAEQVIAFESEARHFDVRRLLCLPQYATAAIYSNHICPLRGGEVSYVMPRFNAEQVLENIEKFQITEMTFMPPMIISVLNSPLCSPEKFLSLQYVHGGGAAISQQLQARLKKYLPPGIPFTQKWGMSETCGVAICLFHPEDDDTGSIGKLVPNLEAKLIDESGREIPEYNKRGELCIRGPTVMLGYLNNPMSNASAIDKDGWLLTGDIGYIDKDTHKWYILDRKKDMIKVQGFQVAPAELEGILLTHPGLADAAVVGTESLSGATEIPVAFAVRKPGHSALKAHDVLDFVHSRVISYKKIKGGIHFVDIIPKSAAGKILKNELREQARIVVQSMAKL